MNDTSHTQLPNPKPSHKAQNSGRTILVGVLGGVFSAVAFTVYQRLPEEQRERFHEYVRSTIAARLTEFSDGLNL